MRGATEPERKQNLETSISIHAPRAGRDSGLIREGFYLRISIHAPRAGRDIDVPELVLTIRISIHAPRAGRDLNEYDITEHLKKFQSTRPVRGATELWDLSGLYEKISIHAPRAGRDKGSLRSWCLR